MKDSRVAGGPAEPARNPLVEEILGLEFWDKSFYDSMSTLASLPNPRGISFPQPSGARVTAIRERRAALLLCSEAVLLQRRQELLAQQEAARAVAAVDRQKAREAAAADREQKQFYNQPDAVPNFDYWLKFDFWTFDQALALLLGKNPNVVTWERIREALAPPRLYLAPKPVATGFLKAYENLRTFACASEVMTASARLRPVDVARWGRERLRLNLPQRLADLLAASEPKDLPTPAADARADHATESEGQSIPPDAADRQPVLVKRAALRALSELWPSVEGDLRHSDRNGLAEAAKAPGHGMWREQDALEWARRNGRLRESRPGTSLQDLPRRIFRTEG